VGKKKEDQSNPTKIRLPQASFTNGVFLLPPRGLGMGGDLVNPSLSPNPIIVIVYHTGVIFTRSVL
jgi:hypothetical protein